MRVDERLTLKKIQLYSWVILLIMTGSGWFFAEGNLIAGSIIIGGIVANISFWLLEKDLSRLLQGELAAVKARFFIKYYARLAVVAVVLFLIIRYRAVDIMGLLAGLSTVFISIAVVAVLNSRKGSNI
jgi:hypothetical protein